MGTPREPKPVKYFVALLSVEEDLFPAVEDDLTKLLGPVESSSKAFSWTVSQYYEREMGPGLKRRFVAFAPLRSPERLPDFKLESQRLEQNYRRAEGENKGRRVNIDPGYLEAGKIVLASTKDAAHRIHLRSGIYAETALLYHNGAFRPYGHTYPDYFWPETLNFFSAMRSLYLSQLREFS